MSRSLSWTEPERLAKALARAGVAEPRQPGAPASRARNAPAPAEVRMLLPRSAEPSNSESAPPPPDAIGAPGVRLEDRLESFLEWLKSTTRSRAAFVLDPDGLTLSRSEAPDDLLAVAPYLLSSVEQAGRLLDFPLGESLSLSLALDGDRQLRLESVPSPIGRIAVGMVAARPSKPVGPGTLSELLSTIFAEKE